MLKLENVVKNYRAGETIVPALKGVSMSFRDNEFVAILGPSGCGKTTLLNIIGGLDRYDSGDLEIDGVSTKRYKDADWDTYRNHSIGFIFQSYNLIPHQTVLGNVELALTLSGASKQERKEKAKAALIKVGLEDQINKMPNQLSGGQMQRVAIARAIVNDPKIILADEPTGALDSETSVQVLNILQEIASDRLVIMVTHNGELANQYATRTIKLLDGKVIEDSLPYQGDPKVVKEKNIKEEKQRKPSMSFWTALMLSLKNLFTKKTRTLLTAFAGSIGIIGIALILSLSSGFNNYISTIEKDTLSTYPISIEEQVIDMTAFLQESMQNGDVEHDMDAIYANNIMTQMLSSATQSVNSNDLAAFKTFLDGNTEIKDYVSAISYSYNSNINIYKNDYKTTGLPNQLIPFSLPMMGGGSFPIWQELLDNQKLLDSQYEFVTSNSRWPSSKDEVILIVNNDQELYDYILYALGLRDKNEIYEIMQNINNPDFVLNAQTKFTYDEIIGLTYKLLVDSDYYAFDETNDLYVEMNRNTQHITSKLDEALEIEIVGIVKVKDNVTASTMTGAIGYTHELTEYIIDRNMNSDVMKAQLASPEKSVLTGEAFTTETEYKDLLVDFGYAELSTPSVINIYPLSFEAKEEIVRIINEYNATVDEQYQIRYTDYMGIMMSSISTIINAITYVLIAFVAISLVVSSIMIGIITYISVLERTKEIGVLRSIGASKKDISRVFNAETLIVGFVAGAIGIGTAFILTIPINIIINLLADIGNVAQLPIVGAIILVAISMVLTFISGLIPSRLAAKKDPVIALRSE